MKQYTVNHVDETMNGTTSKDSNNNTNNAEASALEDPVKQQIVGASGKAR